MTEIQPITAPELRALIAAAKLGVGELADEIGVNRRKFGRMVAGDESIGREMTQRIFDALGLKAPPWRGHPDKWTLGLGMIGGGVRFYLHHLVPPRFTAQVVDVEPGEERPMGGMVVVFYEDDDGSGTYITGFEWIDEPPGDIQLLAREATEALHELSRAYREDVASDDD